MSLSSEDIISIREKYRRTLKLPSQPNTNYYQFFLCPVGLVGAGKSTAVKLLTEKFSLIRISSDEIRKILKKQKAGYEQLMEILKPLAKELSAQGYSLAFDADCGNPKTKEFILELATKVRAKVFWIHIDPPEDFILNKLQNYKHTWLFKNGKEAVDNYFQQKARRKEEKTEFNFIYTFDTSKVNLTDQIERVFEIIKKQITKIPYH